MPDNFRIVTQWVGVERQGLMSRGEMRGDELGISKFVRRLVEAESERLHRRMPQLTHAGDNSARVEATRQIHPQWHVADKLLAYGLAQVVANAFYVVLLVTLWGGVMWKFKIAAKAHSALLKEQIMRWWQATDTLK